MIKRSFDLLVSTLGLIVLAPFLLLIALVVRSDSPGPALYSQERVGRHGIRFQIFKFRTMFAGRPEGNQVTAAGDPRITRVGAFLRRTKLDELPQLINVIRGDMSIVGPRPEVPRYVALYPPQEREIVLSVRPGITDEAAIEFAQENELLALSEDPEQVYKSNILPRKLDIYVAYVQSRSFLGDLRILVRTLVRVIAG
jgi:lipopolysaccharide/colanic/teichoic acid biosynthesis glycosyltransferase